MATVPPGEDPAQTRAMAKSRAAVARAMADTSERVYRVYCDGIFDLCHIGHMKMIQQAKNALGKPDHTYLMVGVCSDELTHRYKGKTVMDHKMRCETVSFIKGVDQVLPDAPWVIQADFLTKHKVDFVAHDAVPYESAGSGDVYAYVKEHGMFLETQREPGVSTSDLIMTLIRDYDDYVKRNLARGFSKESMNVDATWEIRNQLRERKKKLGEALTETHHQYTQLSQDVRKFVRMYSSGNFAELHDEDENKTSPTPAAAAAAAPDTKSIKNTEKDKQEASKASKPNLRTRLRTHGCGLLLALWHTFVFFRSYVNPFNYEYTSSMRTTVAVIVLFAAVWNTMVFRLGATMSRQTDR
eukprot:g50655.t1